MSGWNVQPLPRPSLPELTAAHLREGLQMGRWMGTLPGAARLARELDVSPATVRAALRLLEAEGLLGARGAGRSRCIADVVSESAAPPLRVGFLGHDAQFKGYPQLSEVMSEIVHSLEAAGHRVFLCKKTQVELSHDIRRIAGEMAKTPADAWLIEAGSLPLLEWCASQPIPCHALYGRFNKLPLAGTGVDKVPAFRAAVRQLYALGHRRIVLIVDEARRKPTPGIHASAFLEELTAHGITTGQYNLPDWEASPAGFYRLLERLFLHTPPTALIIDETARFIAASQFLARRGIHVPQQVSLISTDDDIAFAYCQQDVSLMRWDNQLIVRRVVRWVNALHKGRQDQKTINIPAEFVPGGSIGPVWKG